MIVLSLPAVPDLPVGVLWEERMDTLGARLRQLRKARGYTLLDVGAKTGLSVSFLSDVERGRTKPSLDTLEKLASTYGCAVSELLQVESEAEDDSETESPGWRQFLREHPAIDGETRDLLRRIEHRAKERARTAEDWTRMYYTLLTLLGR